LHAITSGPDNMQTVTMQIVPESGFAIRPLCVAAGNAAGLSSWPIREIDYS
jgi:hypothetical protein